MRKDEIKEVERDIAVAIVQEVRAIRADFKVRRVVAALENPLIRVDETIAALREGATAYDEALLAMLGREANWLQRHAGCDEPFEAWLARCGFQNAAHLRRTQRRCLRQWGRGLSYEDLEAQEYRFLDN